MDKPDHSWERQPGEGNVAWASFLIYRDLPSMERTYRRVAEIKKKSVTAVGALAKRWSWRSRADDFDRWKDRQSMLAEVEAVRDMKARHVKIAMGLQGVASIALNKLIEAEKAGKTRVLRPVELREMIDLGTRLERLSRGEFDRCEKFVISKGVLDEYRSMSNDELVRRGREALERMGHNPGDDQ